ncbi:MULTISPECIES: GNAT family N-acetyltransferase [unclassified Nocardioides]|uniref:GNAT family N-acetyltransferase n=1 Tax=unclassified Nocardioides TaxID=2615069 RepID=UPI0024062817|nr:MULTISPECIES: GNAT family N-acetyltransferase [unclassified Nocardioides]MDF9716267.1 GNAT family N-acetyltransferase [Nocardioides sp. ChNu-99]
MIPDDSRFERDPDELLASEPPLPDGWSVTGVDPSVDADVDRLVELLRGHEVAGRGWAGAGRDGVLVEISDLGTRTRANAVVRDPDGVVQGWGSVHDRAAGRMLLLHVVARDLDHVVAARCARVLLTWAEAQAREVGAARGLPVQQIDTGAFTDDPRQHAWLSAAGFERVRTWWQMSRPVTEAEAGLVPDPERWEKDGVVFRAVGREGSGMPDEADLRKVHHVLEGAFTDHFNSREETFAEFVHRLRQDPGHRWDHWWLAEIVDGDEAEPAGALVATESESDDGPHGSYVDYLGVLANARGRGVAKGLLHTVIADAALRGRNRVGLEVDADSPTGADGLYTSMGWTSSYLTQSWHKDVPVTDDAAGSPADDAADPA